MSENASPAPQDRSEVKSSPFDWPILTKWRVTLTACYVTLIVGINSTSITAAATSINEEFNVSDTHFPNSFWPVTSWNAGAAIAPMLILPIMENQGMRIGYLITYAIFTLFVIPQAFANNFATLIVTRFFAGCCGGVLQDVMDGIIADVWNDSFQRSLPVTIYVFCLLFGVTLGPVFGGAVTTSLQWRWMFYIQLILYGTSAPLVFFAFKETRTSIIIHNAAEKNSTDERQQQRQDANLKSVDFQRIKHLIWESIGRPTYMLVTEPTVFFFTLLSALSYGIIFMSTQSVTQVFTSLYSFSEPSTGLAQSSILIGEVVGFLACLIQNKWYSSQRFNKSPTPESRLPVAILGTFLGLAAGLFLYGWTSRKNLHWLAPCSGLVLTGFGSVTVMQAIMMYVTDAYVEYAASASAAVCMGENLFAAFLPLATARMYTVLGFAWASSLLGFSAVALGVAPAVLIWKGAAVRKRSTFMKDMSRNV